MGIFNVCVLRFSQHFVELDIVISNLFFFCYNNRVLLGEACT